MNRLLPMSGAHSLLPGQQQCLWSLFPPAAPLQEITLKLQVAYGGHFHGSPLLAELCSITILWHLWNLKRLIMYISASFKSHIAEKIQQYFLMNSCVVSNPEIPPAAPSLPWGHRLDWVVKYGSQSLQFMVGSITSVFH